MPQATIQKKIFPYSWIHSKISKQQFKKNFHTHEKPCLNIKVKISIPIEKWVLFNHVYTLDSHNFIPIENQKSKTNAQISNTMQSSTNHQHYPNLSISNNPTIQIALKKIINMPIHNKFPPKSCNIQEFPNEKIVTEWQCPPQISQISSQKLTS